MVQTRQQLRTAVSNGDGRQHHPYRTQPPPRRGGLDWSQLPRGGGAGVAGGSQPRGVAGSVGGEDDSDSCVYLGRNPDTGYSLKLAVERLERKIYGSAYDQPERPLGLFPRLDKMEKDLNMSVAPTATLSQRASRIDHYLIKLGRAQIALRKKLFGFEYVQALPGVPEHGCGLRVLIEYVERQCDFGAAAVQNKNLVERLKILFRELGIEYPTLP